MQPRWFLGSGNWASRAGVDMRNKDGTKVSTEAEARQWLLDNPEKANEIAAGRIKAIDSGIRAQAKKDGVKLSDKQVAGMASAVWHANGGGSLAAMSRPITDGGNPLHMLMNPQTKRIMNDPASQIASSDAGDGVSHRLQYTRTAQAFGRSTLKAANMRTGGPGSARPPGSEEMGMEAVGTLRQRGMSDKQIAEQIQKWVAEGTVKADNTLKAWCADTATKIVRQGGAGIDYEVNVDKMIEDAERPGSGYRRVKDVDDIRPMDIVIWKGKDYGRVSGKHVEIALDKRPNRRGEIVPWVIGTNDTSRINAKPIYDLAHIHRIYRPPGYRNGGYTGDVGRDDAAGIVHGQEFVVNAAQTAKYRPILEAMNSGRLGSHSGGGEMKVDVSGTIRVEGLSTSAQSAVAARASVFRQDVQRIVANDVRSHTGIR